MKPKVLLIAYVWPEPKSSAAGLRVWTLLNAFRDHEWPVVVASPSRSSSYRHELESQGFVTVEFPPNDAKVDGILREIRPDVVIFDRFVTEEMFGWRVQSECPQALRVLDTQDLHFLRRSRAKAIQAGASLEQVVYRPQEIFCLAQVDLRRELASIYRSDLTWVLSSAEFRLLTDVLEVPARLLSVTKIEMVTRSFEHGAPSLKFVMIGNFRHEPNADGVRWLRREIWPKIREHLPSAEVHIYGSYPSREDMDLDDEAMGFRIKGWAEDSPATLASYRVSLAPLRFGAGIKGKIIESWSVGTPVITTGIGAEGLQDSGSFGGIVADSAELFASQAIELVSASSEWERMSQAGIRQVREEFAPERVRGEIMDSLQSALSSLEDRRSRNVVGQILWQEALLSKKYFSKWIETKEILNSVGAQSSKDPA